MGRGGWWAVGWGGVGRFGCQARKESQLNKTLTYGDVAELYSKNMPDSDKDEEARCKPSIIEGAIIVYEKVFNNPEVRGMIEKMDKLYGKDSPCNSISKILEIHYKCKSSAKLIWWFKSVYDGLVSQQIEVGDLSLKKIRGAPSKPGISDVVLIKKAMRDFMTGRFLDRGANT